MNQPILIPGGGFGPGPTAHPPRSGRGAQMMRAFIVIWVLAGGAFLVFKWQGGTGQSVSVPVKAMPTGATAIGTEDLLHHMDAVNVKMTDAAGKLRRAEEQLAYVLPSLERNYLPVEKRRAEHAMAAAEAARRDIEQGREEFDLILNSLRKEHELQ